LATRSQTPQDAALIDVRDVSTDDVRIELGLKAAPTTTS
jgi:hypothetical protein